MTEVEDDAIEVSYEDQTDLYRQIGRKDWDKALAVLKEKPHEAKIYVCTKYSGGALTDNPDDEVVWYRRLPLHHACGAREVTEEFIQALVDVYPDALLVKDETGKVPLVHAARRDNLPVIKAIMTDETASEPDDEGKCALHWACEYRASLESIKVLAEKAPLVLQHKDVYGRMPMHWECSIVADRKEKMSVITFLVDRYPDAVKITDIDGRTPLQMIDLAEVFTVLEQAKENLPEGDDDV